MHQDLQEFAFANGVIVIATGWGIGTATRDMIHRLLNDVFVPLYIFISRLLMKAPVIQRIVARLSRHLATSTWLTSVATSMGNISWDFLSWISVVMLTFILLEYVLYRGIIGIRTVVKSEDKAAFEECKRK
jgi:large-conductance mechanosensitive channel